MPFAEKLNRLTLPLLGLLAASLAVVSLAWRIDFDTPLFLYIARLMDWGYEPYRDINDQNLPGTYILNLLIFKIFGSSDFGVRLADLSCLTTLAALTWHALRPLGRAVAWAAPLLFTIHYLGAGPLFTLQRDFLLLLPISLALLFSTRFPALPWNPRLLIIGALYGFAALIKPHVLLGLPPTALYLMADHEPRSFRPARGLHIFLILSLGLLSALVLGFLPTVLAGAWPSFREMVSGYWPLYNDLNGHFQVFPSAAAKIEYRALETSRYLAGSLLLLPALLGTWLAWSEAPPGGRVRRHILLLLGLCVAFLAFAVIPGKIWDYHFLPWNYTLAILAALGLHAPGAGQRLRRSRNLGALVLAVLCLQLFAGQLPRLYYGALGGAANDPQNGRVDQITAYLKEHLEPGDLVQPLDITGGAVHAMLRSDARLATSFIYGHVFFHHVSSPYTQNARKRFIAELREKHPRFFIEIRQTRWWTTGPGTSPKFDEMYQFLQKNYKVTLQGDGFNIHEFRGHRTQKTTKRINPPKNTNTDP